jgi:hypothetical protein
MRLVVAAGVVALAVALVTSTGGGASTFYPAGSTGYDVSYPQCGTTLPRSGSFGIVGVTNGLPWSVNPCLSAQYQWAAGKASGASLYVNTANPGPISKYWTRPGPRACADPMSYSDLGCAYNYGWNAANEAWTAANAATSGAAAGKYWWLDVETVNSWNGSTAANGETVLGYLDALRSLGAGGVGIYSTAYQWSTITGGRQFAGVSNWVAGARNARDAAQRCGSSFAGGPVWLVQYIVKGVDSDYVCR